MILVNAFIPQVMFEIFQIEPWQGPLYKFKSEPLKLVLFYRLLLDQDTRRIIQTLTSIC